MKVGLFLSSFVILIIFMYFVDLSMWESLAISFSIYYFLVFLNDLGKKIIIMDLAIVMAGLTCLVMPVIFYHNYTKENPLARLWVKFMFVPSDTYFEFAVPAVVAMALGIRMKLGKNNLIIQNPKVYIDNMKKVLEKKSSVGMMLIAVGVISGLVDFIAPKSLAQVFYLLDHLTFVGAFYVIYSPNKYKRVIVPAVILLMVAQSLATGMFGDMIFMLACTVVLIMLGNRASFYKKFMVAAFGFYLVLIMQSVKSEYRSKVWAQGNNGGDISYYFDLVTDRITNPGSMFDPEKSFFMATRLNQGWLVATTMYMVPDKFEFAYGETIWQSVAAAIVPRFLWPDKPEAGGAANLKRFWGYQLRGYSMNIGPLGEAYANFNVVGGAIFMFFYGLFFSFVLYRILKIAENRPTVILWVPFLFFYAIGVETDLLTTMGSLLKGVFFVWIVFRAFRIAFRIDL